MEYVDLLSIPYLENGRDPRVGLDCWGLAMELYRRQGITLPDPFAPGAVCTVSSLYGEWRVTPGPVVGGAVAMSLRGETDHIGVIVKAGYVMHAMRGVGVVLHSLTRGTIESMVRGYYVYAG